MKLFNNKAFKSLLLSTTYGLVGRTLFDIAFVLYATQLSNTEVAIGIVSIATSFPYVMSFILGYLADLQQQKYESIKKIRLIQFILFLIFSLVTLTNPNWYTFAALVIINILCDVLGGYASYMTLSLNTQIVDEESLPKAIGMQNSISETVSLVGKSVGVFLLLLLAYNYAIFGVINALLFLIAYRILVKIKEDLKI